MKRDDQSLRAVAVQREAQALFDQGQYKEAREMLERLRRDSPDARRSANLAWMLSIICDNLHDLEAAFSYIDEAITIDPVCPNYNKSFDIILNNIRSALGADERTANDPSTPRLYGLLVRVSEADCTSHLVMANYHLHTGNHAMARRLIEAVTVLDPTNRAAWTALAEVAGATGDTALAAEASAQAAALEEPLPLFGVSGVAQG